MQRAKRPAILWTLVLGLWTLLVLACGPGGAAPEGFVTGAAGQDEEPKRGGIITVAHSTDPAGGWDPMRVSTIDLGHAFGPLTGYGNLLKACREDVDKICPGVAERWEANVELTQYTFKIRDDVKWHDGQPFTGEDGAFWLELAKFGFKAGDKSRGPALYAADLGGLTGVEVLDGNRVRAILEAPNPFWPAIMANLQAITNAGVIWHPKHLMLPHLQAGEFAVTPADVAYAGIGPYRMDKYEKGSLIQVRRFPGYWEKDPQGRQLPFLDGVDMPIIQDPSAMDAAFRTGRIDAGARGISLFLTESRYEALKNAMGDQVWFGRIEGAMHTLNLNSARPGPLQDARVRRAMSLWLNREALNTAVMGGPCCGGVHPGISPDSIWPNPDWKTWPGFDPATKEKDRAEARRLLAEAGYHNGFELPFMTRRPHTNISEFVVGELAPLGVRLTIEYVDEADRNRRERAGDYFIRNFGAWDFNPSVGPEQYRGRMQRHSVNSLSYVKHEDPKVEEYFQRLERVAANLEERVKVWRELERYMVLDQALAIPGFVRMQVVPYRSYVKGAYVPKRGPGNNTDWATVWLDK